MSPTIASSWKTYHVPVVNLFEKGHWRAIAITRITFYFFWYFYPPFWVSFLLARLSLWLSATLIYLLGWKNFDAQSLPPFSSIFIESSAKFVQLWPNPVSRYLWWYIFACLANGDEFANRYVAAWTAKISSQSTPSSVHLYVDGNHLYAPIPTSPDDSETFRMLRMWYCLMQFRSGLAEILLPKKLMRIDRICKVELRPVGLGSKIESLVLGRSKASHVAFFEAPDKVRGQITVTQKLIASSNDEGLEFVRSWNTLAVSAIVLLPFVLSLVFAGVWVGIYVARGIDVQLAMQTAFTVASYIVTAGALFIALIAFLDGQSPKEI